MLRFKKVFPVQVSVFSFSKLAFEVSRVFHRAKIGSGGRNSKGRITQFRRGGESRSVYRLVDVPRFNPSVGVVRMSHEGFKGRKLFLICYEDGTISYIIAPEGLDLGSSVSSGPFAPIVRGSHTCLSSVPTGFRVHNIFTKQPGLDKFSSMARASGCSARVLKRTETYVILALPSGEHRAFFPFQTATCGSISFRTSFVMSKAGHSRLKGIRPKSRGVATNPVDHPHGGRTRRGNPPRSFSFKFSKGTRTARFVNPFIVSSRRVSN